MEQQMQSMSLDPKSETETPELAKFRSLPPKFQHQLLYVYPRLLATAMHQYSSGMDCELVLKSVLEGSPEMLRIPNSDGDAPISVALLNSNDKDSSRADWLMRLAEQQNPEALEHRSKYFETLPMLSTSSSQAGEFIQRLLARDPTQLHRPYDCDGRNLLHHCAMESSISALEAVLKKAKQLLTESSLTSANISAAVHMNDERGDTPMHLMAVHNRSDMLALLVEFCKEAGIPINLDERRHFDACWTPLMVAVHAEAADAVRFLLDHDADPCLEDKDGKSVQQLAEGKSGMEELIEPFFEFLKPIVSGQSVTGVPSLEILSVDSGIQSAGAGFSADDKHQASEPPCPRSSPAMEHKSGLTAATIAELDNQLMLRGQAGRFLEAMRQLNPSLKETPLLPQTDKPVVAAFSFWAHLGPVQPNQVAEALKSIGAGFEI